MGLLLSYYEAPLGRLLLAVDAGGALVGLDFAAFEGRFRARFLGEVGEMPDGLRAALDGYFGGDLRALEGVRVLLDGTAFQQRVWAALRAIPVGETRSYGHVARAIGQPGAVRAVGTANARNPVMLVVPCHRVIGSGGALAGYAGGMERKAWLLRHEGAIGGGLV